MKVLLAALLGALVLTVGFGAAMAVAQQPSSPPGHEPCSHGNNGATCRPDPQPEHGKDCEEHGPKDGGVNEDHCLGATTGTTGTTTTGTTTTGTTGTTTTPTGTTGTPRGVATAAAICVPAEGRYRVVGEIDGVLASVSPEFIAGNRTIPTIVTVTLGADSQQVLVNTAGTCVMSDEPPTGTTTTTSTGTTGTTATTGTTTTTPTGTTTTTGGGGGSGGTGTTTTGTTTTPPSQPPAVTPPRAPTVTPPGPSVAPPRAPGAPPTVTGPNPPVIVTVRQPGRPPQTFRLHRGKYHPVVRGKG